MVQWHSVPLVHHRTSGALSPRPLANTPAPAHPGFSPNPPTKGVPELAGPVLKSLQTLGLAVVGSGRSQPQQGEFAKSPRVALSPLSESGRWPRRAEQFEIAPPVYHPERDRLPSPPSPAVAQSSGICRLSITSSPNHRKRRRARCCHRAESARPLRIKPSVGRMRHRYNQNHRRNLHCGFSTRLFVAITASVSIVNVIRLAIYTDTRPPWERGEVTNIRLLLVSQSPPISSLFVEAMRGRQG